MFYGWWIVVACLLAALIGNALGLFGAGIYLLAVTATNGWPIALVSGAVTLLYVVSAVLLIPVGSGIRRHGPQLFIALGGVTMAGAVAGIGQASAPWQAYLAFFFMGIGWACLSTTAVATTLAPWFEKHQGRAVSIASLGASIGGMISAPLLLFAIQEIGFGPTTAIAGALAIAVLLPLAILVMRHRPQDLGLFPDGAALPVARAEAGAAQWTRRTALATVRLRSVMATFGLAMMVQIGLVTHQATFLSSALSTPAVSATLSATAVAALLGRLALARFADQIDSRTTASAVLLIASAAFMALGLLPSPGLLVVGSIAFGLTVGNVTTLAPIIVRREFGAASFGPVFGVASCGIQLAAAFGPGLFGMLRDTFGSYCVPLLMAAALDVVAAMIILVGGRGARRLPA